MPMRFLQHFVPRAADTMNVPGTPRVRTAAALTLAFAVTLALAPLSSALAQDSKAAPRKPAVTKPTQPAAPKVAAAPRSSGVNKSTAAARKPQPAQRSARPAGDARVRATIQPYDRAGTRSAERGSARAATAAAPAARNAPSRAAVSGARATPVSLRARPDTLQSAEAPGDLVLRSSAVLVLDQVRGNQIFARNVDQVRSIASITKLMTALVVLDYNQSMDELISITEDDLDATRRLPSRLAAGTTLSRGEMLRLSLMSSENRATAALARTSPGGYREFIAQMNLKARALGMHNSRFEDPTGLLSGNVSTALDLVHLVNAGMDYPLIREFTTTSDALVGTPGNRAAQVQYHNSNLLVARPDWQIGLSKTGFIREAGRCLVMQARINGEPVIIVLLDSDGRFSRIGDANRIRRWIESGYALRLI
jgi:serine-type D-Ala-D-Ala endopeptidase (penicillin-binding protein 7)